ncbi:MAG: AraC family transcriptional regulator [Planctomycetia bacterium]
MIATGDLAAARETTGEFWPKHVSEVLGPEEYRLEMNRVLLGGLAVSYVHCTTSIRVIPSEPSPDSTLYVPLEGSVEIVADGRQLAGSRSRPLLRGPFRTTQFEATAIRCLVVDVPAAVIAEAATALGVPSPNHAAIWPRQAGRIVRLAKQLAHAVNSSRTVAALQRTRPRERLRRMPEAILCLERSFVRSLLEAAVPASLPPERLGAAARCDVDALKAWLKNEAHRPLRITELAERSGVSSRSVERAFLRTGCTPLQYLRGVRLELARRMLADPAPLATVADAAIAAGFTHLGRFAAAYRRRFGELPSQTLVRIAARQSDA